MKRLLCAALVAGAFVTGGASAAIHFTTTLDSAQEVAPNVSTSPATGFGTLTLLGAPGSFSLAYTVTIDGLDLGPLTDGDAGTSPSDSNDVTGFHIHNAARGVNGGVVYGIFGPDHDVNNNVSVTIHPNGSATIVGSWDPVDGNPAGNINTFGPTMAGLTPGQDAPLYFNFHTVQFGGGAIRGQIVAVPEPGTWALLIAGLAGLLVFRRRIV
jgi:hypothetical protein